MLHKYKVVWLLHYQHLISLLLFHVLAYFFPEEENSYNKIVLLEFTEEKYYNQ